MTLASVGTEDGLLFYPGDEIDHHRIIPDKRENVLALDFYGDGEAGRGATIHLVVTIRNPAASTVTVSGSSSCLLAFRVLDAQERVLAARDQICTMELTHSTVPADGMLVRSLMCTGNAASGAGTLAEVPPGEYRVTGMVSTAART